MYQLRLHCAVLGGRLGAGASGVYLRGALNLYDVPEMEKVEKLVG